MRVSLALSVLFASCLRRFLSPDYTLPIHPKHFFREVRWLLELHKAFQSHPLAQVPLHHCCSLPTKSKLRSLSRAQLSTNRPSWHLPTSKKSKKYAVKPPLQAPTFTTTGSVASCWHSDAETWLWRWRGRCGRGAARAGSCRQCFFS